jgi:hypothetical protein
MQGRVLGHCNRMTTRVNKIRFAVNHGNEKFIFSFPCIKFFIHEVIMAVNQQAA